MLDDATKLYIIMSYEQVYFPIFYETLHFHIPIKKNLTKVNIKKKERNLKKGKII